MIVEISLAEDRIADAVLFDIFKCFEKCSLILNPAKYEMGVVRDALEIGLCAFGNSVTGLDDLLPKRNVFSDENVDVWGFLNLVLHDYFSLECRRDRKAYPRLMCADQRDQSTLIISHKPPKSSAC